ncbi:hypothetical protein FDG2_5828 [Candidatus Protofrankia californiensis]|uniref:Uncharacterized protein n=1 Tax=Candidatus Protofrankia californiensis TaxID=1839754 RepID=A0A1C3PFQ5_9ACTN|nr:hypothetical protein FDG2_5828 [Candidatus Protofrankia californiensis]
MRSAEKNSGGPRVVIDETSFDFRGLSDALIERHLDELNETLRTLRADSGPEIACAPMWEAVKCLDDCELYQFLCGEYPSGVDRDTRLLSHLHLSRCPEWDDVPDVDAPVSIDGGEPVLAFSVAYALSMITARYGVACLVFPGSTRRGYIVVHGRHDAGDVFFFYDPAELPAFWRRLFALENVPEPDFFELAGRAFPNLVLHAGLSFGRLDGSYTELRVKVVSTLAALNDRFIDEYRRCKGVPSEIQAALGRYHIDLSPESPNTRRSRQLMRLRDVSHNGHIFRCEWHAKLERHRNRIHFSEPSEILEGKIFIGIFVTHLDT